MVSWGGGNLTTIKPYYPYPQKILYRNRETSFKQFFYNTTFMQAFVLDLPSDRYCAPVLYT